MPPPETRSGWPQAQQPQASLPAYGALPAYSYQSGQPGSSWKRFRAVYYAFFGLSVLMALIYVGYYGRVKNQAQAVDNRAQQLMDSQDRVMQGIDRMMRDRSTQPPDSVESAARRELQRLDRRLDARQAPGDSNGEVHLLGGGTITREQWEKARKSLSEP